MIPKHIIEKAIAGGYIIAKSGTDLPWTHEKVALDPDFWTALGKEMGWKRRFVMTSYGTKGKKNYSNTEYEFDGIQSDDFSAPDRPTEEWIYRAHRFYDLILRKASQEEVEKFWRF